MKFLVLSASLFFVLPLFGQKQDSIIKPRFILKLAHGVSSGQNFALAKSYWNSHFTTIPLPASDSSFHFNGTYGFNLNGAVYVSADFPLKNFGKKGGLMIRASVGMGPKVMFNQYSSYEYREGILDTLHSSLTNTETYVTQLKTENYSINSSYQTFQFGTGITYSTNLDRLFAFQTGLLAHYGIGFVNELQANKYTFYTAENGGYIDYGSYMPANDPKDERVQLNKTLHNVVLQMPFELSMRLGKKPNFASKMRIGLEMNPGVNMTFFDGISRYSFAFSHYLSIRVAL